MNRFSVTSTALAGLKVIRRQKLGDERGFVSRIFCAHELADAGWHDPIVQINHTSTSRQGTVRGMHFQYAPHAEMKLVSCIRGAILDVAIDVRHGSPSFLQWHAERLSADNNCALMIPEGFAHGFQALTDEVEIIYCHSAAYHPEAEGGLHPLDQRLAIAWPLPVVGLSTRDANHPFLDQKFEGVRL